MIKLIASDIDGTLVPEGSHEISQGNRYPFLCMQRQAVSKYA